MRNLRIVVDQYTTTTSTTTTLTNTTKTSTPTTSSRVENFSLFNCCKKYFFSGFPVPRFFSVNHFHVFLTLTLFGEKTKKLQKIMFSGSPFGIGKNHNFGEKQKCCKT